MERSLCDVRESCRRRALGPPTVDLSAPFEVAYRVRLCRCARLRRRTGRGAKASLREANSVGFGRRQSRKS
jgi:hypothetical protein